MEAKTVTVVPHYTPTFAELTGVGVFEGRWPVWEAGGRRHDVYRLEGVGQFWIDDWGNVFEFFRY